MGARRFTRKSNWGRIVKSGMGGFLNPPGHPEHEYSVHSVYGDTFSICLSSAVTSEWLNDEVRTQAGGLLKRWESNKPALDSPEIQDWICQVMGYFRDCYCGQDQGGDISWNVSDLRIGLDTMAGNPIDPILNQDIHAGVNFIRKYYPEFKLEQRHVDAAYWGSKKE